MMKKKMIMMRSRIYDGKIEIIRKVPGMIKLCNIARSVFKSSSLIMLDDEEKSPLEASYEDFKVIESLCRDFESRKETLESIREVLRYVGLGELKHTYIDRPRLRIQPSDEKVDRIDDAKFSYGRFSQTLPVHRDTWGSGISQQINWWGPLFELDENRTLQIYPSYFNKSVPNTSSSWDYFELKRCRKESSKGKAYSQMPVFDGDETWLEKLSSDAVPIVVEPGDLVLFSGTHLHSSVPNHTGLSRISTEWRTFDSSDFQDLSKKRGAPNPDGTYLRGSRTEWFRNVLTDKRL